MRCELRAAALSIFMTIPVLSITGVRFHGGEALLGLQYARVPERFAESELLSLDPGADATQHGPKCWQPGCNANECSEQCNLTV